jgi:hypothetical protein
VPISNTATVAMRFQRFCHHSDDCGLGDGLAIAGHGAHRSQHFGIAHAARLDLTPYHELAQTCVILAGQRCSQNHKRKQRLIHTAVGIDRVG